MRESKGTQDFLARIGKNLRISGVVRVRLYSRNDDFIEYRLGEVSSDSVEDAMVQLAEMFRNIAHEIDRLHGQQA